MQAVVLASGSQYRAQLLSRLGVDFRVISPDIDESIRAGEPFSALSLRLAREKALKVSQMLAEDSQSETALSLPDCLIIASDQVASVGNTALGKPGTEERAIAQLSSMSGQCVEFFTSLHILQPSTGRHFSALDITSATLRVLDHQTITRYLAIDKPLDCAGSFKVESIGISLFETIKSDDPTALIGLPLIKVCEGLRHFGVPMP
ncbi:MAG: nucleoside triphosphate pyrophosphatase [Granulosicoccus sp.]